MGRSSLNHLDDRFALEEHLGHDQFGAGEERGVGGAPGVDVEHRHDQQAAVAFAKPIEFAVVEAIECSQVERCE